MTELPKKPTETPQPAAPEGDRSALRGETRESDLRELEAGQRKVKEKTKQSIKQLRKGIYAISLDARRGEKYGNDRAPYKHAKWLAKADERLKDIEKKFINELRGLIPDKPLNHDEYKALMDKIEQIVKRHETEATYYAQALEYAVKALTGVSGALKTEDYAVFDSLMDNIDRMYAMDAKTGDLIINIQQKTPLSSTEWDVICSYIEKYPYQKEVAQDQTRINMSITALLIHLMDSNQRYELVLKFHERNNGNEKKTSELIKTLTETNILNIAQMTQLMKKISGSEYALSPEEEKRILQRQEETLRLTQEVRRTMQSPLVINSAERIFNGKSLAACAAVAIGGMGMVMNYLSKFNKSKGLANRLTAGFASPYFLLSAAVTAGGVHYLGSGMRPGEVPGFFDRIFPRPKRQDNPFGVYEKAEERDAAFTELVSICSSYKTVEKYLFEHNGFKDVSDFYIDKRSDISRMAAEAKVRGGIKQTPGKQMDEFDEYLLFIEEKNGNKKGKAQLKLIEQTYGRPAAKQILFRLISAVHSVGILSDEHFKTGKIKNQEFTFNELYKHRAGIEPLTAKINPPPEESEPAVAQSGTQASQPNRPTT